MNKLTDTTPEADAIIIRLLRQVPSWRKLQMMEQLNAMTLALAVSGLRQQYPDCDADQVPILLAERLWGPEIADQLRSLDRKIVTNAL